MHILLTYATSVLHFIPVDLNKRSFTTGMMPNFWVLHIWFNCLQFERLRRWCLHQPNELNSNIERTQVHTKSASVKAVVLFSLVGVNQHSDGSVYTSNQLRQQHNYTKIYFTLIKSAQSEHITCFFFNIRIEHSFIYLQLCI